MRMLLGIVKSLGLVLLGALLSSSLWLTHQAQAQPAHTSPAVVNGSVQVSHPELSYQGRLLDPTTGAARGRSACRSHHPTRT